MTHLQAHAAQLAQLAQRYTNAIKAEKLAYETLLASSNTASEAQYQRLTDALMAAIAANDIAFAAWANCK